MTIILALLTIFILIALDAVKRRSAASTSPSARPVLRPEHGTTVISRYYHPGHCWALVEHGKPVIVGADDFTQRLVGSVDEVALPLQGTSVRQGQPLFMLRHGDRRLTQVSPLSGIISGINPDLIGNPRRLNESPYDKGWIAQITPTSLSNELRNLMKGVIAERWEEAVRIQLFRWFTPELGTVLHDGGEFIDNIGDLLTDEQWQHILREFYPSIQESFHKGIRS